MRKPILLPWSDKDHGTGCTLFIPFQDPGNVGTVIRSAAAFGVSKVVLLKEAAPVVLRVSGIVATQENTVRIAHLSLEGRLAVLGKGGRSDVILTTIQHLLVERPHLVETGTANHQQADQKQAREQQKADAQTHRSIGDASPSC